LQCSQREKARSPPGSTTVAEHWRAFARATLYAQRGGHSGPVLQRSEWRQMRGAGVPRMRARGVAGEDDGRACGDAEDGARAEEAIREACKTPVFLSIYNNPSGYLAICGGRCHLLMIPASTHRPQDSCRRSSNMPCCPQQPSASVPSQARDSSPRRSLHLVSLSSPRSLSSRIHSRPVSLSTRSLRPHSHLVTSSKSGRRTPDILNVSISLHSPPSASLRPRRPRALHTMSL
jgi:hypothetical protein